MNPLRLTLLTFALVGARASADTLHVPGDYSTLQAAINAALDGDVVLVADGTHSGPGNVNLDFGGKSITVRSAGGAASCVIDCEGTARAFYFHTSEAAGAVVDGFTVTNGAMEDGGAILCEGSDPTIRNCSFTGNAATGVGEHGGGAIACFFSSPTIENCSFTGNTATGGGDSSGGAIVNVFSSSPSITGCTFTGNAAFTNGGAVFNVFDSAPQVTACTFEGNSGTGGGAVANTTSSPTITDCSFTDNTAVFIGGAIDNFNGIGVPSEPVVIHCTFTGNSAGEDGGAMWSFGSNPSVSGCTFEANSAGGSGGALAYESESAGTISDCGFTHNISLGITQDGGGAISCIVGSNPTLTDCVFVENTAPNLGESGGGGMLNAFGSSPSLTNCSFQGNSSTSGGGMFNIFDSSPTLLNCTFVGNSATVGAGGAFWAAIGGTPTLTGCEFSANVAVGFAGAVRFGDNVNATLTDCNFVGNSSAVRAGAVSIVANCNATFTSCRFMGNAAVISAGALKANDHCSVTLTNSIFSGNSAFQGGAIEIFDSQLSSANCTFSANSAQGPGGAIFGTGAGETIITNCIVWANTPAQIVGSHHFIEVSFSLIHGWLGKGNIDADPMLADADGPDGVSGTVDDNLRLLGGSSCIDAGNNTAVPFGVLTDLDGSPRFVDDPLTADTGVGPPPVVDMGAYEDQP